MKIKLFSLFCAVLMVQGVFSQNVSDFFPAGQGSGTSEDPYVITTPEQLNAMRYGGENRYYKLGGDIDLTDWIANNADEDVKTNGWRPVDVFRKTLDGAGYTISGLWINRPSNQAALFYQLQVEGEDPAIIKDLTIELDETKGIIGSGETAALAARVNGSEDAVATVQLINCHVKGNIKGSSAVGGFIGRAQAPAEVTDCSFEGKVEGADTGEGMIGGIVGQKYEGRASFKITDSFVINSEISGTKSLGGLAGIMGPNSVVENSYVSESTVKSIASNSNAIGGLIGNWGHGGNTGNYRSDFVMSNCFSTANIELVQGGSVGGIAGECRVGDSNLYTYNITACYSAGTITGEKVNTVGGLFGFFNGKVVIDDCYSTTTLVNNDFGSGGLVGGANESPSISITNSYALNPLFKTGEVGALVGKPGDFLTVTNCFAIDDLSELNQNNATSITKEQANVEGTYDFDFASTWTFGNEGYNLPVLQNLANQPTTMPAHLVSAATSIDEVENAIKYSVNGKNIEIEGGAGFVILSDLAGVSRKYNYEGRLNIPVKTSGVYILNINNSLYKVLVK